MNKQQDHFDTLPPTRPPLTDSIPAKEPVTGEFNLPRRVENQPLSGHDTYDLPTPYGYEGTNLAPLAKSHDEVGFGIAAGIGSAVDLFGYSTYQDPTVTIEFDGGFDRDRANLCDDCAETIRKLGLGTTSPNNRTGFQF